MLHVSVCFSLFASLLQSRHRPPTVYEPPVKVPHGGERALCDSDTAFIDEKGPHEAKGMELKGSIKAKKPTRVKGPTERKLKCSATPEWR